MVLGHHESSVSRAKSIYRGFQWENCPACPRLDGKTFWILLPRLGHGKPWLWASLWFPYPHGYADWGKTCRLWVLIGKSHMQYIYNYIYVWVIEPTKSITTLFSICCSRSARGPMVSENSENTTQDLWLAVQHPGYFAVTPEAALNVTLETTK